MKSKIDKSLLEVWEMKDRAYKAFLDSGYDNYIDYLNHSTQEVIKKYNIQYKEKEKQLTTA